MDFYSRLEQFGESPALLVAGEAHISYVRLAADADLLGARLAKGSLAFNFCQNNAASVTGYLGFLRAGVPQALINPATDPALLQGLFDSYRPRYLWSPRDLAPRGYLAIFHQGGYTLSEAIAPAEYRINPQLALLLTTSGSTGSPKFVRLSFGNLAANAASIAQYLEIGDQDRPITTLPMSYTYGLSIINSHLLAGSAIVLNEKSIVDRDFWSALKALQATGFGGVPFTYEMLRKLKFERMELPHLNKLTQAGGKLPAPLAREFSRICREKNIRFFIMYGQTEATARISYLDCSGSCEKVGSVGKAIPGGRLSLVDELGATILQDGVPGELVYQGDNVSLGYATGYQDLVLGDQNGGTLRTGDIAQRDQDGFYYIVGRKKRVLKLFGSRVDLDEIEHRLSEHGIDAACTGRDDMLEIHTPEIDSIPDIHVLIKSTLRIHPNGFTTCHTPVLPRTASGKIDYCKLVSPVLPVSSVQ